MKAIIHLSRPKTTWQKEFFPDTSPYMLPFLGKPLVEFYLDYCSLCQIRDIEVVADDFDEELNYFLGTGGKWGLNITTSTSQKSDTKNVLLAKNSSFVDSAQTLFFVDGYFFPLYNKKGEAKNFDGNNFKRVSLAKKQEGSEIKILPLKELEINTITDYFQTNMNLLKDESHNLVMKGYGVENNVFMGMNDSIIRGVKLLPPFMLGDNVQVETGTKIGENTIIGDSCIIDRRTKLVKTIVFSDTYVGADLDLDSKIIFGNTMIDPLAEIAITFTDNFFTSSIRKGIFSGFIRCIFARLISAFLMLIMSPIFLLFVLFAMPKKKLILLTNGVRCPKYERTGSFSNALFFKFSMDKFVPMFLVLTNKLHLVGDSRFDIKKCEHTVKRYKNYTPAAFSYADSIGHKNEFKMPIDDLFYRHNRSIKADLQVILRSFVGRLFANEEDD